MELPFSASPRLGSSAPSLQPQSMSVTQSGSTSYGTYCLPSSGDEQPRVSVLMPMRNAANYVEEALRSILMEEGVPLEVVVVDDGSTDRSRAVVESLKDSRIRIVDGPCDGIAAAFNAALDASRGDIVMRCDADDLYTPQRIARQAAWLDAHAEFGAICGGFSAMDDRGRSRLRFDTPDEAGEITTQLTNGETPTHFCTFAVRRDVLRSTGGMRSFFLTGEDIDLQLRIGEACRVWYSPELAYHYRIHDGSITHVRHARENLSFENLAREFQRQRKLTGADDLSRGNAPLVPHFGKADGRAARSHIQDLLISSTWSVSGDGDYRGAIRDAVRGAAARPASFKGWRNLVVALLKLSPRALRQRFSATSIGQEHQAVRGGAGLRERNKHSSPGG